MAKDTRIFRVTRHGGRVQYCNRTSVSGMFGQGLHFSRGDSVLTVEATNAEATEGWHDVTSEFRDKPEVKRCQYHPRYRGIQRPRVLPAWYARIECTCWKVYLDNHSDYPRHSRWCDKKTDPAECDCRILEGLME